MSLPSGHAVRPILEIDESRCNGCGQCLPSCAEGALRLENGKVRIIEDKLCDGLGACLNNCPRGALRIIERTAEPFSEHAVAARSGHACPSAAPRSEEKPGPCEIFPGDPANMPGFSSADKHWPLKLALVPPKAEFLAGAHWLLTADCAPAACPSFAQRYLRGKVMLLACPKLENKEAMVEKMAALLRENPPKAITLARMEVPCCCLPQLVRQAQEAAGTDIPVDTTVITRFGQEKMPDTGLGSLR